MRQAAQRHVGRGTGEAFRAGQLDRRHPQAFDVTRMTDRTHRDPIVDLENLLPSRTHGDEKNSVIATDGNDRAATRELRLDVLATIGDCFDPPVRLFDHATLRLNNSAVFSVATVLIPSRATTYITGKILAFRSMPPVAVSDSAAVSRARNATVTASSSLKSHRCFGPQVFS